MGLVVQWYDFICFGIVGVSFVGAVYVIWTRGERSLYDYESLYEREHVVGSAQLWLSCWRGLNPLCLMCLRFASFVILSCLLAWDLYKYGPYIYIYYTEWTFTLVVLYFAIGTVISAYGCAVSYSKELPISNGQIAQFTKINDQESIQERAGFWGYLMQTAYQTCAGAVIMTDLVFWCIIVPFLSIEHLQLDTLMGCMHTLNLVFLLLDAAFNSLPFPWFRLAYFVLWSCCYVIYQWVLHACGYSTWPYPFLELSTPWASFWYLCLAVAHIPCYGLFSLLVRAKNSFFSRLFPLAFVSTS